ncbi:HalOD1 output domain-containing protein [Halovivax sp.]|uniref:HalOD1 output domain-containing protein n=1 Tax=Halovivax sp. TaxID=1935978 RepID=UPI0025C5D35D|nr:HalOD1 output domain-containing protein [Halovivax sp.]
MLVSVDSTTGDGESLSLAIVEAVAEREGVDVTEIEPPEYQSLYEVCDPEALDVLFSPREGETRRSPGEIKLRFCGYDVVVTSDGGVTVDGDATSEGEETDSA